MQMVKLVLQQHPAAATPVRRTRNPPHVWRRWPAHAEAESLQVSMASEPPEVPTLHKTRSSWMINVPVRINPAYKQAGKDGISKASSRNGYDWVKRGSCRKTVADYFAMLVAFGMLELSGFLYNKAAHRRALIKRLFRSFGAVR